MKKTEIILQSDGALLERVISERALNAEATVLETLTESVTRRLRDVFVVPGASRVSADVGPHDTVWTVTIDRLPLHARYELRDNVLVPTFLAQGEIELPLVWVAPPEVQLRFVVLTTEEDGCVSVGGNWLFACDREKRGYRLPLPNLFDDARICTGAFSGDQPTAFGCVKASLEQFQSSKWNADLLRTAEQARKFFRFAPEQQGFLTLPIQSDDWTRLCDKVATALFERVSL